MITAGQQIAIVGAGVTGRSAARYVARCGAQPLVLDTRAEAAQPDDLPAGVEVRWGVTQWPDIDARTAIVSPGLALDACLLRQARNAGVTLYSDIDVFFAAVNEPVIGVTGTNGKSTVTALAGHLLNYLGHSAGVGGNLGDAALDIIAPEHDCYVLELSSFQLERSRQHAYFRAVILNISEDHLDHHGSLPAYIAAKQNIYARTQGCIVNRDDSACQPHSGKVRATYGLLPPRDQYDWGVAEVAGERCLCYRNESGNELMIPLGDLPLQGQHNEQNMLAACALVSDLLGDRRRDLSAALRAFKGLPHRFEEVAAVAGVRYVNDSKATNLGATLAALEGLPVSAQTILIAGGDAKGVDLSPLQPALQGRVKHLVVLGAAAAQLVRIGGDAGVPVTACTTLEECVAVAAARAVTGDTVLLSPACSSLDMFSSFAERGRQFSAAARGLAASGDLPVGGGC
ncbi:MAG: UDP-N-acetylmuramoyl-L-alanine--D-glutamate ligase [Pseudomonadota bacterium]